MLAERKWRYKGGNIPSSPFLIVCPVNLHNQWIRELERFLQWKTFDVFPYVAKYRTRTNWWDHIFTKSMHAAHHQIILATDTVRSILYLRTIHSVLISVGQAVQDDACLMYLDVIRDVGGEPKQLAAFSSRSEKTIYGHEYLGVILNEAHSARKFNKIHTAFCALRKCSQSIVAMTATPVMTKFQVRH